MVRVLTRPMFRKGGLSRETGIMSGLDRKGYAQGSYAPRVGYKAGSMWNPLNWFKGGVPVQQFGPVTGSYYRTHTMAPESFYKNLEQRIASKAKGLGSRLWSMVPEEGLLSKATRAAPVTTGATVTAGLPLAYAYGAKKLQESLPEQLKGEGGIYDRTGGWGAMGAGADIPPEVDEILRGAEIDITGEPLKPEEKTKAEGENETLIDEQEKQSIESDFESVYKDILPIFKRELAADPESTAKEKYIALAQFGSRLLGEPGGDLAGAVGRAAEKPLEEVGKIMAKETKAKRSAKEAALTIAAQKYLKDDAVKDKVEGFKKYLPNTSEEEIAKQLLLPAGTENIKLRILEDNKKVFLEHMGDPANVKGGNTYANEQLHMSENQEKFKGINFKKLPIKDSVVKTDKIPEKGDYYINPETGEHGFMSKDGTWTSITEKDFPSFV